MKPLVSVVCITYNHEKYIADAIEGFLMQETDFPYEIIIHDDASIDKTSDIIREYEKKYPQIIKPIYQKENQYSKGNGRIRELFIVPKIKGKYVAVCEGDDYWTDKNKLQKQFNFLEENKDYIMCFHPVAVVNTDKVFNGMYIGPYGNGSKKLTLKDASVAGVMHASSWFMREEYYTDERPAWMDHAMYGDFAFALYITSEGNVFFIDEVMSNYRTGVQNSMMTIHRDGKIKEKEINLRTNMIETFNLADEYYNFKYHEEIQSVNLLAEVTVAVLQNDFSKSALKKYRTLIKDRGMIRFIKIVLLNKFPSVTNFLVNVKGKRNIMKSQRN